MTTPTPTSTSTSCPGDDLLATFMQGGAGEKDRALVEKHIDTCETCRDLLAQLAETFAPRSKKQTSSPPLFGTIDRYELLDVVGRGAMGTVYEARDPVLGRHVAVKVIEHAGTDEARLLREGRAMARVAHQNVVRVHDAGVDEGRVFIAMELIRGSSLREHLDKRTSDKTAAAEEKIRERIALFIDAARGLAAAHNANVIHRDFKPENVVVSDDGEARVTDFGLARPPAAAPEAEATLVHSKDEVAPTSNDAAWLAEATTRGLHGTPAYISPEQLDGDPVTQRSDQFSFGVALFEALYGVHPFGLGTPNGPTSLAALRAAMLSTKPRDRLEVRASTNIPAFVWPAIERALRVDPNDRFENMIELAHALEGPDETTRRRIAMLVASLVVMFVVHLLLLLFVGLAIVLMANEPPEPAGSAAATADMIAGTIFFTWAPLGVPLTIVSAYGLSRARRWSYLTTAIYALISMPTVIGTPFTIFALYVLSRPSLRKAFGR